MARITRNKAAEILGVSRQTISNYIKEGILGSYVGEHGILYVNSEDIEKYAQKYKMIAANEKMIDEKLKEVEYRKRAINVELTELRDRATANGKLAANAVGMLFGVINTMSHLGAILSLSLDELIDVVEDILLYRCSPSVDDGFDFVLHPCCRKITVHIDIFFHGRK